jgi:hypothetical protein
VVLRSSGELGGNLTCTPPRPEEANTGRIAHCGRPSILPVVTAAIPGRNERTRVAAAAALIGLLALLVLPREGAADDAGAPRAPTVVPADLEDVEHMCALLTSCERLPLPPGLVPGDFAACTRAMFAELASPAAVTFSLTLRDCGLRASSCGELRTCALRGAKADVCAGRGKGGAVDLCDGEGRAVTCQNERVALVRDCPRGGEQCVVRDGKAVCALGACDKDSPATCSPSGTRVLECSKGKLLSLDCAAFGLRCVTGKSGPECATTGAACPSGGATRCEGGTAIGCFRGHDVRVDCAARGLACAGGTSGLDAGGGSFATVGACATAVPAKGACDPAAPPRCDGATLRWCAWGQPRGYLCKSVGLSRCVADDKGARCVP